MCHFMSFWGHPRGHFTFEWLWYRYSCTLHVTLSPMNRFLWMIMVSIQYILIGCQSPDVCQTKFQRKFLSIKAIQKQFIINLTGLPLNSGSNPSYENRLILTLVVNFERISRKFKNIGDFRSNNVGLSQCWLLANACPRRPGVPILDLISMFIGWRIN